MEDKIGCEIDMTNVTIKDIAKELNVSIATVSRVLNNSGYASKEMTKRVLATAKRLNYQPNGIARSLKKHQTNTIGVIIPDISNPFFMKISKGIEDTVLKGGYHLIFASSDENPKKEKEMLKVLFEKRVDSIVLATAGENDELIKRIKFSGVPIILIDRKIKNIELELDYVIEDNEEGAYQLTSYLIHKGHKRIGVVNGSLSVSSGHERYLGYKKALLIHGLHESPDLIYCGNFTQGDGYYAAEKFLSLREPPTAIISFNNTMAFGVLHQLTQQGLSKFKNLVIASYGENEAAQLFTIPEIVCIKQAPYEMGVRVGEIIINKLVNNDLEPIYEKFKPILNITN
ncbi:LacI family DNA-binding transcriptional regulator [Neobacillus sp. K501]